MSAFAHGKAVGKIWRLRKTVGGYAAMFLVMHLNFLADGLRQLCRDRLVANAEIPELWGHAAAHVLRQLAFVGLADPALPGKLQQDAGAVTVGISPGKREPGP